MCLVIRNGLSTPESNYESKQKKNTTEEKVTEVDIQKAPEADFLAISTISAGRFSNLQNLSEVLAGKLSLKRGDEGEAIESIQKTLTDLGFYNGDSVDGKFGKQTETAISNFQDSRSLPKTGQIDKKTLTELIKIAPPPGKKLWDDGVLAEIYAEFDQEKIIPNNTIGNTDKRAKAVIDLSEHRLFLYDQDNNLKKVYSVATGKDGWADGRGGKTHSGIKFVDSKNDDPSQVAKTLWPETKGRAFGTKLLGLSFIDPETGKKTRSGEELHGTYDRKSIGTDASHGCMRMQNEDIEEVFTELKVGDLIKVQD